MSDMIDPMVARIEANPKYHELKRKRSSFGWLLTVLMLLVYYGYVGLIAFDKELLAQHSAPASPPSASRSGWA